MVRRHVRRAKALAAYAHTGAWRGRRARLVLALGVLLVGIGAFVATAQRAEEPLPLEASGAPEQESTSHSGSEGEGTDPHALSDGSRRALPPRVAPQATAGR